MTKTAFLRAVLNKIPIYWMDGPRLYFTPDSLELGTTLAKDTNGAYYEIDRLTTERPNRVVATIDARKNCSLFYVMNILEDGFEVGELKDAGGIFKHSLQEFLEGKDSIDFTDKSGLRYLMLDMIDRIRELSIKVESS